MSVGAFSQAFISGGGSGSGAGIDSTTVSNDSVFVWSGGTSYFSGINNTGIDSLATLQDSILVGYDFAGSEVFRDTFSTVGISGGNSLTSWNFTREANNPVIDQGSSSYSGEVVFYGGKYHSWQKVLNPGGYFTSNDGISFTYEGVVIPLDAGTWYANKSEHFKLRWTFDGVDTTFWLFFSGTNGQNIDIGYATNDSIDGVWNIQAQSSLNSSNSGFSEFEKYSLGDVIYDNQEEKWRTYVTARDSDGAIRRSKLLSYTLDSLNGTWNLDAILATEQDFLGFNSNPFSNVNVIQGGSIFRRDSNEYVFLTTVGTESNIENERRIIEGRGSLKKLSFSINTVLTGYYAGERQRVYNPTILKDLTDTTFLTPLKVNGNYRLYHSGHSAPPDPVESKIYLRYFPEIPASAENLFTPFHEIPDSIHNVGDVVTDSLIVNDLATVEEQISNKISTDTSHVLEEFIFGNTANPDANLSAVVMSSPTPDKGGFGVLSVDNTSLLRGSRYGTSFTAPTNVSNGQNLFAIQGVGYLSSLERVAGELKWVVDGSPSGVNIPTKAVFSLNSGSSFIERMTLNTNGTLRIHALADGLVSSDATGVLSSSQSPSVNNIDILSLLTATSATIGDHANPDASNVILSLTGNSTTGNVARVEMFGNGNGASVFRTTRYGGTDFNSKTDVSVNSIVGGHQGYGWLNGDKRAAGYIYIRAEEQSGNNQAGSVEIWTHDETTTNPLLRMKVDKRGSVGIGTSTPNASSLFDVSSTTKGFLGLPRMTPAQRDAIGSPATGLGVFNTSTNRPNWYDGSGWYQQSAPLDTIRLIRVVEPDQTLTNSTGTIVQGFLAADSDLSGYTIVKVSYHVHTPAAVSGTYDVRIDKNGGANAFPVSFAVGEQVKSATGSLSVSTDDLFKLEVTGTSSSVNPIALYVTYTLVR